jgi:hypothetical protein
MLRAPNSRPWSSTGCFCFNFTINFSSLLWRLSCLRTGENGRGHRSRSRFNCTHLWVVFAWLHIFPGFFTSHGNHPRCGSGSSPGLGNGVSLEFTWRYSCIPIHVLGRVPPSQSICVAVSCRVFHAFDCVLRVAIECDGTGPTGGRCVLVGHASLGGCDASASQGVRGA